MKNIYNSIRYIKSRAVENWINKNIQAFRQPELQTQYHLNRFKSIVVFVCICMPPIAITVFLIVYIRSGLLITVTKMSFIMRLLGQLTGLIWELPANMFDVMSAYNSITRLTSFLASPELPTVSKRLDCGESDVAAIAQSACFRWCPIDESSRKEVVDESTILMQSELVSLN